MSHTGCAMSELYDRLCVGTTDLKCLQYKAICQIVEINIKSLT